MGYVKGIAEFAYARILERELERKYSLSCVSRPEINGYTVIAQDENGEEVARRTKGTYDKAVIALHVEIHDRGFEIGV